MPAAGAKGSKPDSDDEHVDECVKGEGRSDVTCVRVHVVMC
jgi:hypothetical protein